jgi:hypothetical protein
MSLAGRARSRPIASKEIEMLRSLRSLKRPGPSATDGDLQPVEATYAEQLYRHYAGLPGWRSRDRNVLATHDQAGSQAGAAPSSRAGIDEVACANARTAAHEQEQVRASDDAVIRDAREGRMPG